MNVSLQTCRHPSAEPAAKPTGQPVAVAGRDLPPMLRRAEHARANLVSWLAGHGIALLRITMGAIFLGFGVLKFFPGISPAQDLALDTTHLLTLGLVPDSALRALIPAFECGLGLLMISGRCRRLTGWWLSAELVGILSPLVLLTGRMFAGPHHAPTLEGQYVVKDVILAAAAIVIYLVDGRQESGRVGEHRRVRRPAPTATPVETTEPVTRSARPVEAAGLPR